MSTPVSNPPEIAPSPATEKTDGHKIRFPPFPTVPEGVTIIPFKDFKEHGIQVVEGEDEIELDGLGIPTVQLRVKHDTDFSKTNPNRKRKTAREMAATRPGFRKEWWEDWEEGEDLRNHGPYNANAAGVDRFHQAASDFQRFRKFPPAFTNVQWLWDQFRIFSGLLSTTPVWQKTSEKAPEEADNEFSEDDFGDEDDSNSKSVNQGGPGEKRYPARLRPRAPYDLYGKAPTIVNDNDDIKTLLDAARASKEDKVVEFLNDPARSIQVFLSSYMKYQGIVYADRNLVSAPHLLRFFVNYLLRNHVLPDKTTERSLRSALEIIDRAAKELPLTAELGKKLPDDFSVACQGCWGRRVDSFPDTSSDSDVDSVAGEPEAKRVKLNPDAAFESALMEENVEVIKQEDILAADPTVATVAPDSDVAAVAAVSTSTSTTDTDADAAAPADAPAPTSADSTFSESDSYDPSAFTAPANPGEWEEQNSAAPETDWAPPARTSLFSLLGPTVLPLTHEPGIVEWSVRRVKSISPPPQNPPPAATGGEGDWAPDAEGVERELEGMMWRVVMTPWAGWDGPESESGPRILRSSNGALAPVDIPADVAAAPQGHRSGLKPHDMLKDDITLLFDQRVAETLCVDMGLGGTWMQLARCADLAPPPAVASGESGSAEVGSTRPKKKKALTKAQKERRGLRYWYLDEHMMVLPSYWVV